MALSYAEIRAILRDLSPRLEGGRIERIDQPERHKLVLTVRNGPALHWLLVCVHPRFSRLHLLTRRPEQGRPAAGFCNMVRQHLTAAPLEALRQVERDRVVRIECTERDRLMRPHRRTLLAELVGVGSNLVLLDEEETVLAVLFRERSLRRELVPGVPYTPLDVPEELPAQAREDRFSDARDPDDPLALSRAVQAHYARLEAAAEVENARAELLGMLRSELRRLRRRRKNVARQLALAEDAEGIRRRGELLKIALPDVAPGQSEVVVEDLFEPDRPPVTIPLDPARSPEQNAELIFRRYKKAKGGRERLAGRAQETSRQIERIEPLVEAAESAGSVEELAELKRRAAQLGVSARPEPKPGRRQREAPAGPRRFVSADGLEILVARNSRQNEKLTFTIARGNDYWMHLTGWPGPHVVMRKPPARDVPRSTLIDAAHLAVHFSRIRGADRAEVVYTQCKHVRRLKGAGQGKVSYAQATAMAIRIEPERLERLLRRDED